MVTLRNVEASDLATFFEQQLDPEANRMAAFVRADPCNRAAFDAHWKRIMASPGIVNRTILLGTKVAGYIACYPQEGELEVTYWIGREYWGKGIATQALKELLQVVTHRPLFARAAKDNLGSIRVLEKCGFKIIGENKDFALGRGEETEEFIFRLDGENQYGNPNKSPMPTEPAAVFPQLTVVNLAAEGAASTGAYRNVIVNRVNDHCLRLSAFEGDYRWHFHPGSDELFVVVEGLLAIDLADGSTLPLHPWDMVTIPAGMIHRTRALPRAVNLTVESFDAETTFVEPPDHRPITGSAPFPP